MGDQITTFPNSCSAYVSRRFRDFCRTPNIGTVAQWLRYCNTNRKVAGSIPAGVSGPGVDSASNRNEYREYFMRVKAAGA